MIDPNEIEMEIYDEANLSKVEGDVEVKLVGDDLVLRLSGKIIPGSPPQATVSDRKALDKIAELLRKTNHAIRIQGHSAGDLPPSDRPVDDRQWREPLSRALAVSGYLVSHGVHEEQLEVASYGATRPLLSNESLDGRRKNQRVEIVVIDGSTDPALRFQPIKVRVGSRFILNRIDERGKTRFTKE